MIVARTQLVKYSRATQRDRRCVLPLSSAGPGYNYILWITLLCGSIIDLLQEVRHAVRHLPYSTLHTLRSRYARRRHPGFHIVRAMQLGLYASSPVVFAKTMVRIVGR